MSTIDMWVPVLHIDIKDLPEGYEFRCFKVKIPSECPHCNFKLKLVQTGSNVERSTLYGCCQHTKTWRGILDIRIIDEPKQSKVWLDPKLDGCNCAKCNDFVYMASANQNNNTFICYGCRMRK